MTVRQTFFAILAVLLLCAIAGILAYPQLPERVASHWNAQGVADGFSSRLSSLLLLPAILAGVALLMLFIPMIDPLKSNIELFRPLYNIFILLMAIFMFYLYLLTILWNLGLSFGFNQMLAPAYTALMIFTGVLVGRARRNWFIGIRTPWTLSSDRVWEKTHRLGARLFILAGIVTLGGVFFPNYLVFFMMIPIGIAALTPVVYSYLEYRREQTTPE